MSKEKKPLYEPDTGIHRAKTWEIALYALNNSSTNLYVLAFTYVSYFLVGVVGVGVVLAGTIVTAMRVWDGVTDPLVGFVVDKTNGKFGKNRPFIVLGQLLMVIGTGLIFLLCPSLAQTVRLPLFILFYMLYILGYTCQCVVTKSAQTCLTNDPKQRPMFSVFDAVYSMVVWGLFPMYITMVLVPTYETASLDAFSNPAFFRALWGISAVASAVLAALAIVGLWRKDRAEFFGTGKAQLLRVRDYWEVIKHNRAIQMLCVAACSDKLTMSMQRNSIVLVMLFGIIVGDYSTYAAFSGITSVLGMVVPVVLIVVVARNMGQKRALIIGTWGGILSAVLLFVQLRFGDPTQISFTSLNLYSVVFLLLYVIMVGFGGLSSSIVIPMTADCADYEVYRSGRYVPGLMGTLFSFIDKLISSLASTFVALMLAVIGFRDVQPTYTTPYSEAIFWGTMICWLGAPILGWVLNVIAMRYYPLTKEKMASIQERIAEIKAEANAQ